MEELQMHYATWQNQIKKATYYIIAFILQSGRVKTVEQIKGFQGLKMGEGFDYIKQ